jgi:hypothetical protein
VNLTGDARRRFAARHALNCQRWYVRWEPYRLQDYDCLSPPRHLPAGAGFDE